MITIELLGKPTRVCKSKKTQKGTSKNPSRHAEHVSKPTRYKEIADQVRNDVSGKSVVFRSTQKGLHQRMVALGICVIVPTYNNQKSLPAVLDDILQYTSSVIAVNDGSTDNTREILRIYAGRIDVVSYMPNRGKGYALSAGFKRAEELGYRKAITIDSDGQHLVSEMALFVEMAEKNPEVLLIGQRTTQGDMPAKNNFANKFSNFWFAVQTAYRLNDTQNGFRLYPLSTMKGMRPFTSRYEAEIELLVRSAWKGIRIIPVPTHVYYPPEGERITHFRPGKDFFRISLLNTCLTLLAFVYGYPSMFFHRFRKIHLQSR